MPKIKTIIGDREFVGTKWFKYLKNNNIGILFRIRDNQYAKRYNKQYKVSTIIRVIQERGVNVTESNIGWMMSKFTFMDLDIRTEKEK
ncbi:MAG: hypothetical protein IPL08_13095 [Saprospiraceae bacterium]|nr:hypothetical protein [Saprospiraceae bacterium]